MRGRFFLSIAFAILHIGKVNDENEKVREYDKEIPQSHTADQPRAA